MELHWSGINRAPDRNMNGHNLEFFCHRTPRYSNPLLNTFNELAVGEPVDVGLRLRDTNNHIHRTSIRVSGHTSIGSAPSPTDQQFWRSAHVQLLFVSLQPYFNPRRLLQRALLQSSIRVQEAARSAAPQPRSAPFYPYRNSTCPVPQSDFARSSIRTGPYFN